MMDHLARSGLPKVGIAGNSGQCDRKRSLFELCKLMKKTKLLRNKILITFFALANGLIVIPKKLCILKICYQTNNYKSTHRKFRNDKHRLPRKL